MSKESKKIEKPWGVIVYAWGADEFVKIVKETKYKGKIESLWIKLSEEDPNINEESWDPKYIKTFDSPIKAMDYFLVHNNANPSYSKKDAINLFLSHFPSEKTNLEKLLSKSAQSQISKSGWADAHGRYQRDNN